MTITASEERFAGWFRKISLDGGVMHEKLSRRKAVQATAALAAGASGLGPMRLDARDSENDTRWERSIRRGLDWVSSTQSRLGHWTVANYPTAMTALAGTALLCSGSTTTQGRYAKNVRRAVDYLASRSRPNGLIGNPQRDNRYTYGHGFSMLFLSQVLGEDEDIERREELVDILTRAADFSGRAQTSSGGWGYVSSKDSNFDEGSTTVTQVQGLRGCRNAGIPVPAEVIEKARQYIYRCKNQDGGISYSSRNKGSSRPAITAAALASLYNAGDYTSEHVPDMLKYCKKHLYRIAGPVRSFGHWHYTYLYYSQVVYRQGDVQWEPFRNTIYEKIVTEQQNDGSWQGNIGPIYVTAINLIILQLGMGVLPIFQR